MFRIVIPFFLLLGGVWLGIQLHQDPGYLLIAFNQWTVESTLWVAILAFIIILFLFHIGLSVVGRLLHIPTAWRQWLAKRRMQKAQAKTRQGLIEFSEGYWLAAKNHLIQGLAHSDAPLLNYLTAARSAQEMGNYKLRDHFLREAQQSMPEAKIAVELTQAQLQLANRQWEQALATLKHLQSLAPRHPYVMKLLLHLYEEVRDWPQLLAFLPNLKRQGIISRDEYKRLQQKTFSKAMSDAIKQHQSTMLEKLFSELPHYLKYDPVLIALYCRYHLQQSNTTKQIEPLLRRTIKKHFNDELITLYGQLSKEEAQLNFVESLLHTHPHSATLRLCLGRLYESNHLWGKARTFYEDSINLSPTPAAYAALGQLLQYLNDQSNACKAFRHGLMLKLN